MTYTSPLICNIVKKTNGELSNLWKAFSVMSKLNKLYEQPYLHNDQYSNL